MTCGRLLHAGNATGLRSGALLRAGGSADSLPHYTAGDAATGTIVLIVLIGALIALYLSVRRRG